MLDILDSYVLLEMHRLALEVELDEGELVDGVLDEHKAIRGEEGLVPGEALDGGGTEEATLKLGRSFEESS